MANRHGRNDAVPEFLRRIIELANYPLTSYGTINPWRIAAAAQEKREKEKIESMKARASGVATLEGAITPGHTTQYAIDGCDIHINSDTLVVGDLSFGAHVRVKIGSGGRAKTVTVTNSSGMR